MRKFKVAKGKRIHGLRYSPDGGRLLVVAGEEVRGVEILVLLDRMTGEEAWRLEGFVADSWAVSADLSRFALGRDCYGQVRATHLVRVAEVGVKPGWVSLPFATRLQAGLEALTVDGLAFSPDGSRVVICHGRQARLPDPSYSWTFHGSVCQLGTPGEKPARLASASVPEGLGILAPYPDGVRWAGTGGIDRTPWVFLFGGGGESLARFEPRAARTFALAVSPDGRHLLAASGREVQWLAADTLTPAGAPVSHPRQVNTLAFTPDGRRVLTGCHDGLLRLLDAADGREVEAYDWKVGPVTAAAVAPDGLTAAAAGTNGRVVVWDLAE